MDLADIFDSRSLDNIVELNREVTKRLDDADGNDDLSRSAQAVAEAFDESEQKKRIYEMHRDRLMEAVELELETFKTDWKKSKEISDALCLELIEKMESADIDKIPMADRKPIRLKITVGRKRQITKKWLIESYGKQKADSIWEKVPNYPDKKEIIVPTRFDDEPND